MNPSYDRLHGFRRHDYQPNSSVSSFIPIPELLLDDAETLLVFLMGNGVEFLEPVNDDLFAAHRPSRDPIPQRPESTLYRFDGEIHVLGCVVRDQFCFNETNCTPLTNWDTASTLAFYLDGSDQRKASVNMYASTLAKLGASVLNVVGNLGASALLARNSYIGGYQGPLPTNQWQIEVQHWQSTTLAYMQKLLVERATGPSDPAMEAYVDKSLQKPFQDLCHAQGSQLAMIER